MEPSSAPHTKLTPRIAIVGGQDYLEGPLEDFLYKLHAKYPDATIVTGNGRGAEQEIRRLMQAIGHAVVVPITRPDLFGDKATDCQVTDILLDADVIVLVGNPDASRNKTATAIWKRVDAWREPALRRPLHNIAAPPKKKSIARKRTKAAEQLAV